MRRFQDTLVQCIDDIRAGRASIEDCLDRYPSDSRRLEPLLRIAHAIPETPDVRPSSEFKMNAPALLMDRIRDRRTAARSPWSQHENSTKPIPHRARLRIAGATVAIALVLFSVAGGVAYASQVSLPGDALYSVKLGTEQLRMLLPGDDVAKAELALTSAERRVGEIVALAETGRTQHMALAVEKYEDAVVMVTTRVKQASDKGLAVSGVSGSMAEATLKHLAVLDSVYLMVPPQAQPAIEYAGQVSLAGHFYAQQALAVEVGEPITVELPELKVGWVGGSAVTSPWGAHVEVTSYEEFRIGRIGEFGVVLPPDAEIGVITYGPPDLQVDVMRISPGLDYELEIRPWPGPLAWDDELVVEPYPGPLSWDDEQLAWTSWLPDPEEGYFVMPPSESGGGLALFPPDD